MNQALKTENKDIYIREVGPREGVQSCPVQIKTEDKIKLIQLLSECGLPEIEVTAMVRADRVPSMADSDQIIASLKPTSKCNFSALYLNDKGFLRANSYSNLITDGWLSFSVSDSFFKSNNNNTLAEFISTVPASLELFKTNHKKLKGFMVSNCFGCHIEGVKNDQQVGDAIEKVYKVCQQFHTTPEYIMIADTTGMATPVTVKKIIKTVKENFSNSKIGLHLHDTMGLGIANAYVGLNEGVEFFDSSVAGVGGCPFVKNATGNISTEELVYLCHSQGLSTGVNFDALKEAVRFARKIFNDRVGSKMALTF